MSTSQAKPELLRQCLRLPTEPEAMRALRHDLRTPINPLLGYCELIVEEAGEGVPPKFLAGMKDLHVLGTRMLKLTNEVFSDQPSPLHALDRVELHREFCAPAEAAALLCRQLEQEALAASLSIAAKDLQRISVATDRWWKRIERMLVENC